MLECCAITHLLMSTSDPEGSIAFSLKKYWVVEQGIPCGIGPGHLYFSFLQYVHCDIKYRLGWWEYSAAWALRSSMEEGQEIEFPDPSSLPGMMPKRSGLICVRAEFLLIIFF